MALIDLPPELRTICRRLTSAKVEHLPALLPILLKDISRCQEPLSQPAEPKASTESVVLVHKLKTQITSLLKGRVSQGHFVAAFLVKAVVEAGGWECLRTSESWVKDLISVLQKKGPPATKEICIVTLTKIYTLMHQHPTLVREIVTPTLPAFTTACLQILKPPATSKAGKPTASLTETIFEALSTLIPNHPTTLRQSAGKIRAETRVYLAPTISDDDALVPSSLQKSSRRLSIRLHMTAAKGGDSTEWTKHVEELINTFHVTADQALRAVQETWESSSGYRQQQVNFETEPHGGSEDLEKLPPWSGIPAGSERMIGLLDFIREFLNCRTRVPVTIPVEAIYDITSRISSIQPPSSKKGKVESVQMNPAAGREERDELWAAFPEIQVAVLRLHITMLQRLERNFLPLAQQTLDQVVRVFESNYRLPQIREMAFVLMKELLLLCGPTLPRNSVDNLMLIIRCCCRDLLGAAGFVKKSKPQGTTTSQNGTKPKTLSQNADAFLPGKAQDDMVSVSLSTEHLTAAESLLTVLFSHLPQQHISSSLRSQMLRTAILSRNRDAQVASVLHPARDKSGRTPQVILPYLMQQFPRDESVEILRFNFRPVATGVSSDFIEKDEDILILEEEEEEDQAETRNTGFGFSQSVNPQFSTSFAPAPNSDPAEATTKATSIALADPEPIAPQSPFVAAASAEVEITSLKRKLEEEVNRASKRLELAQRKVLGTGGREKLTAEEDEAYADRKGHDQGAAMTKTIVAQVNTGGDKASGEHEESDDDDESVHLNMELDSDDDEEDEE
ncbi:rRNA processing/ribosome biogenesis-domain-containing protein [Xylariaceae sp. FL0255]|nr:rRNA processing/ribosome biogenesis-domain-containing protein [Xylariaceae sp. FL0255]